MLDNHIIPVSSGLFEHKERIGPAFWEFLWCIDAVTSEEIDGQGEHWGIVLGGTPVKHTRIAEDIGASERTVQRNMTRLKDEGYIMAVRVARGEIIKVRNNKKRSVKNGISSQKDAPFLAYENENDVPKLAHHDDRYVKNGISDDSDTPNVATQKDFKELTTTTATTLPPEIQLVDAYCELHKRLEFHVTQKERQLMKRMIAGGMPVPFIIDVMNQVYRVRTAEGARITSFLYYEGPLFEAWDNLQEVPAEPLSSDDNKQLKQEKRSRQQEQIDELDKFIKEAKHGNP